MPDLKLDCSDWDSDFKTQPLRTPKASRPSKERQLQATEEGRQAHRDCIPRSQNPYNLETSGHLWQRWDLGWTDSKGTQDRVEEGRKRRVHWDEGN